MLMNGRYVVDPQGQLRDRGLSCNCGMQDGGMGSVLDLVEDYKKKVDASLEAIPKITAYAETIQWWIPFVVAGLGFVGMAILINAQRSRKRS